MNITISNSNLLATINTKGAELISLKNKVSNKEYIWEGNPAFWEKHSPVLFPIIGTLKDNSYQYNNQKYKLSRHGFARDLEFQLLTNEGNKAIFSLRATSETKLKYPLNFELQIEYILTESELQIGYKIINNDDIKMPFSIGAHPAFALPKHFEKYCLEFNYQENLNCFVLENDLLSDSNFEIVLENKKLPLSYSIFENDALVFKKLQSKEITILEENMPVLKVKFNDFKNLGIWTKINAPFICIEPWLGYADTIHANGNILEKEGIHFVDANSNYNCSFIIEII